MALWVWAAAVILSVKAGQVDANNVTSTINCAYGEDVAQNGTVHLNGTLITYQGTMYPKNTWECRGEKFAVCKCVARPCFRWCCPKGKAANSTNFMCEDEPHEQTFLDELRPAVYRESGLSLIVGENNASIFDKHFDQIVGYPCPKPWTVPYDNELGEFYLFDDGRLAVWSGQLYLEENEFCYVALAEYEQLFPIFCLDQQSDEPLSLRFILYATTMIFSIPFLVVTFVVYALLSRLHNTHGRCIMSHVVVLLTGYVCLSYQHLKQDHEDIVCMSVAFIIYFAFLASFFWLNVMCLDIWWTFSGFRPMRGSVKEREHKKFIIYSLYCWGSPLIMLIICMIMDLHPGIPDTIEKPGFGELKCWFRSNMGNLLYFSGPIAILIVCNIVLFVLTAVKIRQVKRGTKILKKQDSRRHNEEEENNAQRFNLYLKLFLVMGVNWIMEIVSFAAGGPDEYWYITDIANTLQGVLIFIIFVWKDRIRKLLVERFCPSRAANTNSIANSSSTRTTGIRHNGSVMSSGRPSFKANKEDYQMKTLTSPSGRSDDSDVA